MAERYHKTRLFAVPLYFPIFSTTTPDGIDPKGTANAQTKLNPRRHTVSVRYLLFYLKHLALPSLQDRVVGLVSWRTFSFHSGRAVEDFFPADFTLESSISLTRSSGFTRALSTVSPQWR